MIFFDSQFNFDITSIHNGFIAMVFIDTYLIWVILSLLHLSVECIHRCEHAYMLYLQYVLTSLHRYLPTDSRAYLSIILRNYSFRSSYCLATYLRRQAVRGLYFSKQQSYTYIVCYKVCPTPCILTNQLYWSYTPHYWQFICITTKHAWLWVNHHC